MEEKTGLEGYYSIVNNKKMRFGYTTGSCATGAAKAAASMLFTGKEQKYVSFMTPKGILLHLEILHITRGDGWVSCAIKKDAGDDPDATNGIEIFAKVEKIKKKGIFIEGGIGVGRVTKKGLEQPLGNAAINKVPRAMIQRELETICNDVDYEGGILVTVSVPKGEEIATKTFNPRLGILGGISILGTSGMVEPMSERALLETIGLELRQKRLAGCERLILTPGNYGTAFLRDHLGIELDQAVKCSNFIGDTLDLAVQEKLRQVLLVGHGGKLIKLAAGVMNTHSSAADGRMEVLGAWGGALGASSERICRILEAVTVEQALFVLDETPGLLEAVMSRVMERVEFHLKKRAGERLQAECIIFTNERGILGMTSGAEALLKEFETE